MFMDSSLFTRPDKPDQMEVKRRGTGFFVNPAISHSLKRERLTVSADTECHTTPPNEAAFMANFFKHIEGKTFLEPHAGTGALIKALLDVGVKSHQITANERNVSLHDRLSTVHSDIKIFNQCIFEFEEEANGKFDFIIANPPFKKIKKHMKSCLNLLNDFGVMVALVPITYSHPNAITLKKLDSDTFAYAKVSTKIIAITK